MRVLLIHNTYRSPGGEDIVAKTEAELLRFYGHEVQEYWRSNVEILRFRKAFQTPVQVLWARDTAWQVDSLIRSFRPDIVHVHNTWMMISPVVYWVAKRHKVPVVQTLHNYRILCPNAQFLRAGYPCEICKKKAFPLPGILFGCYRNSRLQTLLVAITVASHRLLGTWQRKVDMYIALTEFAKQRFIEGGLPGYKITVKPNFVYPDPGERNGCGSYALFVGRLSPEKGVDILLEAWRILTNIPLKIAGDGPLKAWVQRRASTLRGVEVLGWQPRESVVRLLKGAKFLIVPSRGYETFGITVIEAFACGVPVIASRLGALQEIVKDGQTGKLFTPGDPMDLAEQVDYLWKRQEEVEAMGHEARREFETKYTAERNYNMLLEVYQKAQDRNKQE